MKLIFERSRPGRGNDLLPSLDVPAAPCRRSTGGKRSPACRSWGERPVPPLSGPRPPGLRRVRRLLPLGSCTMKYNPKLGEGAAALPGFTGLHPSSPPTPCRALRPS